MSAQQSLALDYHKPAYFDGETYDPNHDLNRLETQLGRVFAVMRDGQWRALSEIRNEVSRRFGGTDSEAGISARLRDFRKRRFGRLAVERKRRSGGVFVYRLVKEAHQ